MREIPIPVGQVFGRLTVLGKGQTGKWLCRCSCGSPAREMYSGNIRKGATVSCGCWKREAMLATAKKHGKTQTGTYNSWASMRQRVASDPHYQGVEISAAWQSFEGFYADMGDRPDGTSLDRIDNSKGYKAGNCRWSTPKAQALNRRSVIWITYSGETLCLSDWAKKLGVSRGTLKNRIKAGKPIEQVLLGKTLSKGI